MRFSTRGVPSFFAVFALAGLLSACSGGIVIEPGGGTAATQQAESSVCTTVTSYPGGVAVTGTAEYQYRAVSSTTGLTGNPSTAGIPRAEIVVTKGSTVVQCSETAADGSISLTLPSGAGTYTLSVISRANSTKLKVSVLEDYYANVPYSISTTFTVAAMDVAKNVGTLTAKARKSEATKMEGAAFNILAQIYRANEYLRTELGNASFVAPKVSVYWKAGFNPYTYFGGSSPLSFYRPGLSQLFILGGSNGDVKAADTDHFDNSVILHEYGHFLEDHFAVSDSQGGSHTGTTIIDPRLAWSEGWANFFQAAVIRADSATWTYYIDTVGFNGDTVETGGTGGIAIKVDLSQAGSSATYDAVSVAGEGTFREMSISRFLFKTIRSVIQGGAAVPFSALWSAFAGTDVSGSPVGLASSQVSFRSVGKFNQFLASILGTSYPTKVSDWTAVRSDEQQNADARDYADSLNRVTNGTCGTKTLIPVVDSSSKSNQLRSNDFYRFDHDGVAKTISLVYSNGTTSGGKYQDLDLFVYKNGYVYQEEGAVSTGGISVSSARAPALDAGTETVSLNSLPAGRYLINVKAYTYQKISSQLSPTTPMTYVLKVTQSGTTEDLCPAH